MWVHLYMGVCFSINTESVFCIPEFPIHGFRVLFLIHNWESADVESRMYALFYAFLPKGPAHLRILVSTGVLESVLRSQKLYVDLSLQGEGTGRPGAPIPCSCSKVSYSWKLYLHKLKGIL